ATREKLDRRGVCLSCHQSIPDKDLAVSLMSHTARYAGITIDNKTHKGILHKLLLVSAWTQVLLGLLIAVAIVLLVFRLVRKK
ncbi:MAG: cytochrome C, partial [Chlorobi bacterium]|nr:cytochrome C [Chlorobiota bacterium]